jgi:hypothetical protein
MTSDEPVEGFVLAVSYQTTLITATDVRAAGFQELWPKPLGRDFLRSRLLTLLA